MAVDIKSLPEGTVIFEDVGVETRRGKVVKTLRSQGRRQSDPLAGRIVYETVKGPIEIPFGDKDQAGDYTLCVDDLVQFRIATDRRDQLQRATQITLVPDTFTLNGETRETVSGLWFCCVLQQSLCFEGVHVVPILTDCILQYLRN